MSNEKETKVSTLDAKAKALANEEDEDTKIAKLLKNMPKWRFYSLAVLTVIWTVFQLYIKLVKPLDPWFQLPLHMCLALVVVWLYNPMVEKSKSHNKLWWIYDIFLIASSCFICWFFLSHAEQLNYRIFNVDVMTTTEVIVAVLLVINVMEAVRRVVSMSLFWVICFFLAYAWFGQYIPGLFRFSGISFPKLMEVLMYGENGIFGSPLVTSLGTLFYFLVFGTFFSNCGGGGVLIDGGMKLSDKTVGGPAKAAVISSGLMGMISGSAVANVATTGVMTIPMMKKVGYEPEEAGAVEAVASTGGQIMPPIMGVGAFIMAEMLGVPYSRVAAAAILPAVAYYFAVFILVDRLAAKHQNAAQEQDAKIKVERTILPRLYLLLPAVILVVMIIRGASLMRAGMMGIVSCLICDVVSYFINEKKDFVDLKGIWNCCLDGAKQAAEIAIPTAACGIIINVVTGQTSLATNLSALISSLGTTNLFAAMLIAMIGCMLLGMALPTVAAYLVGVILFVPCLRALGISALCANMFVFYYGIMAQITPPVCVASYTAAGIADANAMKTGIKGFTFAMVGFLVPFVFVYNPAILLEGTVVEIVIGAAQMLLGTFFLAVTVAGYFKRNFKPFERVALFIAALLLIAPEVISSIIGVVLGVGVLMLDTIASKKNGAKAA